MTKKEEFEEIFIEEATIKETGEQFRYIEYDDELWKWIENEIRQAKIDENKRSIDMFLSLPDSEFTDLQIQSILINRNSELDKEK
jgi:hypothetical protein